jgi:hypothetical protein
VIVASAQSCSQLRAQAKAVMTDTYQAFLISSKELKRYSIYGS